MRPGSSQRGAAAAARPETRTLSSSGRRALARPHSTTALIRPYGSAGVQPLVVARDSSPRAVLAAERAARGEAWLQHSATSVELDCVECEDCFQMVPTRRVAQHRRAECPERRLACPNKCGAELVAREVAAHLARDCPVSQQLRKLAAKGEAHREPQPCRLGCGELVAPASRTAHEQASCPNRVEPCEWCGKRVRAAAKEAHLRDFCEVALKRDQLAQRYEEKREDRCVCPQCEEHLGEDVSAASLRAHMTERCPMRIVTCTQPGCSGRYRASEEAVHRRFDCAQWHDTVARARSARARVAQTVVCPQCKAESIPALALRAHLREACPRRPVPCPTPGCEARLPAADLPVHLQRDCVPLRRRERLAGLAELHEAPVECPNGCGQVMMRAQLTRHLRQQCVAREVDCPAVGCGARVQQRALEQHLEEQCPVTLQRRALAEQHEERSRTVVCPLGCGRSMPARRTAAHVQTECPMRHVRCPHADCAEQVRAADLQAHLRYACEALAVREERERVARAREKHPSILETPLPKGARRAEIEAQKRERQSLTKTAWRG